MNDEDTFATIAWDGDDLVLTHLDAEVARVKAGGPSMTNAEFGAWVAEKLILIEDRTSGYSLQETRDAYIRAAELLTQAAARLTEEGI